METTLFQTAFTPIRAGPGAKQWPKLLLAWARVVPGVYMVVGAEELT